MILGIFPSLECLGLELLKFAFQRIPLCFGIFCFLILTRVVQISSLSVQIAALVANIEPGL
jgi:hypothetical protein